MSEKSIKPGLKSAMKSFTVTEDHLRAFCDAVGSKYRGEAPPTFPTVLREGEFDLLDQMGIQLAQALHADQEYTYEDRILPGDVLSFESTVTKAFEKKGTRGTTKFLVFETPFIASRSGRSVSVGCAKSTIIVR
jgi:hypothetical protein